MIEDLHEYFRDWGVTATIGADSFLVIFDKEYFEADLGETGQELEQPFCEVVTADLPDGTGEGTTITIDGIVYTIKNRRDDGTGMTMLDLYE